MLVCFSGLFFSSSYIYIHMYIFFKKKHFSFSAILYQEYSDVAINREIQRQQGKEPGTEEECLRDEGFDGTPSPSNLSPSSSFRSSRGSAFALWQDIPDVRTSGQLDNFSNEERKLQEVRIFDLLLELSLSPNLLLCQPGVSVYPCTLC